MLAQNKKWIQYIMSSLIILINSIASNLYFILYESLWEIFFHIYIYENFVFYFVCTYVCIGTRAIHLTTLKIHFCHVLAFDILILNHLIYYDVFEALVIDMKAPNCSNRSDHQFDASFSNWRSDIQRSTL